MSLMSMTGHADVAGSAGGIAWTWKARSVNSRGLDLRIRLAEGLEPLEAPVRTAAAAAFTRGAVTISLRISRDAGPAGLRVNPEGLAAATAAARAAEAAAAAAGLDLAPMSLGELLCLRGVLETGAAATADDAEVLAGLTRDLAALLRRLQADRAAEGAALATVLAGQIDRIDALTTTARDSAEARAARGGSLLRSRVAALLAATAAVDEARLAQELALLAVRLDVTEEVDRLVTHVAAARKLLDADGPVGRKLDFLTQEFNRETNTLCSKAQDSGLTAIGLELKLVVDQMREQVQNVE